MSALRITVVIFLALSANVAHAQDVVLVRIVKFKFVPAELSVKSGTKVIWENDDETPHSVVARDKTFQSAALDTNDRFARTFTNAGEAPYFCGLHPFMKGKIIVTP